MKRILNFLKKNRLPVPIGIGKLLSKIPYSKRPGINYLYSKQVKAIHDYNGFSQKEREDLIYKHFKEVFSHAFYNIKFYNELYSRNNLKPEDIRGFEDIQKVPIISKTDLLEFPLEDRSYKVKDRLLVNTGGSSGTPFFFYMDPYRYGNEWAHIHDMWSKYGYEPSDLKLSFDGRVKNVNNKIVYDFARNSLLYDIYGDPALMSSQLLRLIQRYPIKYLHGYPSALFEFASYCERFDPILKEKLRSMLKGAFLSSEFPSPFYRKKIEEVFQIPTQSFYGHTETCVLAVEDNPYEYNVYQTYGYAEAVQVGGSTNLIGTSYFNFASPLIRYDTSDLIEPIKMNGNILSRFSIKEGRSGEFILDKSGNNISLTGLIFGRHHEIFSYCEHLQVYQSRPGEAKILYVSKINLTPLEASKYFNSKNINIDFDFKKIENPILSTAGKISLLISEYKG